MTFLWPVPGYSISVVDGEVQGSDAHLARGGREAIDIAAPSGESALAVHAGTIEQIGWLGDDTGYGVRYSWVDESGVWRVLCCHCSGVVPLGPGDTVEAGKVLGWVGATGQATGPHLHLWVERNGERVRPEDWLEVAPIPEGNLREGILTGWLQGWAAEIDAWATGNERDSWMLNEPRTPPKGRRKAIARSLAAQAARMRVIAEEMMAAVRYRQG